MTAQPIINLKTSKIGKQWEAHCRIIVPLHWQKIFRLLNQIKRLCNFKEEPNEQAEFLY